MGRIVVTLLVPVAVAAAALLALHVWLATETPFAIEPRLPEPSAGSMEQTSEHVDFTKAAPYLGTLTRGAGVPAVQTLLAEAAWPVFRGPDYDGIARENTLLRRTWSDDMLPTVLWKVTLGEGHAGAAVLDGCVYLMDYDRAAEMDVVRSLSLADGVEIWRYAYPVRIKRNHGMSRTVPAVTQRYVVTMGPKCHVSCLKADSGELLWAKDLAAEFGAKVPPWYTGQCPLIEERDGKERVILAGMADVLMMAVDCESGEILWRCSNEPGWRMTHSSVVPMRLFDVDSYVYCGSGGVAGVDAESGALLWQTTAWKIGIATVPSPVVVGENRLFLSGGYNAGSMMLQLTRDGERFRTDVMFALKADVFGSAQHTPILHRQLLYGVRPNGELVVLDLQGQVVWASGGEQLFGVGYGPLLLAQDLLFVLDENGELFLYETTGRECRLTGRTQVLHGHDAWAPMALAGGRLLLRDLTEMVCLDVSQQSELAGRD